MEELRATLAPELELIESRVIGPVKELQGIMKLVRKNITKRDHKASDTPRVIKKKDIFNLMVYL